MIKRIGFILLLGWVLAWAYSRGARPAVELDHSVRLWGYELRLGLLLEVGQIEEVGSSPAAMTPEKQVLSADPVNVDVGQAAGELP